MNDYETILKIDPINNKEIITRYEDLNKFIQIEKTGERRVFKSFFRKINETGVYENASQTKAEYKKSNDERITSNKFTKVEDGDNNLGKPEIRVLNL